MRRFFIRWIANALALAAAFAILSPFKLLTWPSIAENQVLGIIVLALIFGLVNAILKPIIKLLTCPLIILTLGLITLLINALLFYISSVILGNNIVVTFWGAFFGAFIVSVVSFILSHLLGENRKKKEE
jgi:putative membrane protein